MTDPVLTITYKDISWNLCAPHDDQITHVLEGGYTYEEDLLDAILHRYGTGGVYIDIGAYIGTHTLFFAAACKADLVVAVEPNPFSFSYLYMNARINSAYKIELLNVAVGDKTGRCKIKKEESWNRGGTQWESTDDVISSVPCLCASHIVTIPPKLIKIDTEGHELHVLDGLRSVLIEHKPVIVAEIGHQEDRLSPYLQTIGYKLVSVHCATPTGIWEVAS